MMRKGMDGRENKLWKENKNNCNGEERWLGGQRAGTGAGEAGQLSLGRALEQWPLLQLS